MSRFPRLARFAAVGVLAVSTLTVFAALPASAAVTATIADNGAGGVTVTYSGTSASDNLVLLVLPEATACATSVTPPSATYFLTTDAQAPGGATLGASPFTIAVGTAAYSLSGGPHATTVTAGSYNFCLQELNSSGQSTVVTVVDNVFATIGAAPTTTTTAAPTTTTVVDPPATPSFTG